MGGWKFLLRSCVTAIISILGVATLNFLIFRILPGNPTASLIIPLITTGDVSPSSSIILLWGLNQPLPVQYLIYLRNMLTFTFGNSFTEGFRLVIEVIILRLPHSLILMGSAALLTIVFGVATGAIAATRSRGKFNKGLGASALGLDLLPGPWVGLILLLFFAFYFPILPLGGLVSDPGFNP